MRLAGAEVLQIDAYGVTDAMPTEEGKAGGVETLDVTPNYSGMFAGFISDARAQAEAIARKPDERITLEDLQAILSRLNVAASAMSSVEEIQHFRDQLNEITALVAAEATRRGDGDEDEEPPVGECVPGARGRYRFVPDGEEEMRPAVLDGGLFEQVEVLDAATANDSGYTVYRRLEDGKLFALSNWTEAEAANEIVKTEDA